MVQSVEERVTVGAVQCVEDLRGAAIRVDRDLKSSGVAALLAEG